MSLNKKIIIISILILLALTLAGFWYYRHNRAKYTPLPPRAEIRITIIPGWNLRQVAEDWVKKGIIKTPEELYTILGTPAYDYSAHKKQAPILAMAAVTDTLQYPLLQTRAANVSYEGYLFPDTYQVYADAKAEDVLKKIFDNLEEKITPEMRAEMKKQNKSFFEILTMASLLEKEANTTEDMAIVADIFWRRLKQNWALQSCASVNYITGKSLPAVSNQDKAMDSFYNTYKYPGLPLGPISNPGLSAIKAALYPTPNNYWYFLSDEEGKMHYARTLEEHNFNKVEYLK